MKAVFFLKEKTVIFDIGQYQKRYISSQNTDRCEADEDCFFEAGRKLL